MKKTIFLKLLLTSSIFLIGSIEPASAKIKDFSCNSKNGRTIATVETHSGTINLIDWHKNYRRISIDGNPASLCQEVSRRMSKYARSGNLNYISIAKFNNRYFVCASDRTGNCIPDDLGLLFTIQSSQAPENILKELFGDIPSNAIVREDKLVVDFNRLLDSKLPDSSIDTASIRYRCTERRGNPITVAETSRGTIELIVWKSTFFANSGYTPASRCAIVSQRFQTHSDAKTLQFISFGTINNQPVICVSNRSGNCRSNGLLLTLEPRDNAEQVLTELFNYKRPARRGGRVKTKTVIPINIVLERKPVITTERRFN